MAAIVAAVGMVVVAVVVRQAIDDDDGDGAGSTSSVVVCATDLVKACEALGESVEVRVEAPAVTAAALADGTLPDDVDAWITSTAWLEVADSRAPNALGDARAIATSATTVATAPGRHDAIRDLCGDGDIWRCLGDAAGTSWADLGDGSHPEWRELKVGLTDPDLATGLPVLASAAAGFFGSTDFVVNDPRFGEFEAWLANLAAPSAAGDPNPALTLATRPGTYSAAGAVQSAAAPLDARGVGTIDPDVPVSATIAVAEVAGGDGAPGTDGVADALDAAGWTRASDADLARTLKPGVMAALHSLWRAVTS
ncbi:MAG: hypothetical protein ACJ739_08745 [Acidimicrobiales bacterium]